jgi:hypothetical protein
MTISSFRPIFYNIVTNLLYSGAGSDLPGSPPLFTSNLSRRFTGERVSLLHRPAQVIFHISLSGRMESRGGQSPCCKWRRWLLPGLSSWEPWGSSSWLLRCCEGERILTLSGTLVEGCLGVSGWLSGSCLGLFDLFWLLLESSAVCGWIW